MWIVGHGLFGSIFSVFQDDCNTKHGLSWRPFISGSDSRLSTHFWNCSLLHVLNIAGPFSPFHWCLGQWISIQISSCRRKRNTVIFLRLIAHTHPHRLENFGVLSCSVWKDECRNISILFWFLFVPFSLNS